MDCIYFKARLSKEGPSQRSIKQEEISVILKKIPGTFEMKTYV